MQPKLYPTLPFADGEEPASFVSRLARFNGAGSASSFCFDMGLIFRQIINGDPESLAYISDLSGAPLESLAHNALRRQTDGWSFRGERMTTHSLCARRLRGCPACLAADIETSGLSADIAVYGRSIWRVAQIRTCAIHEMEVLDLPVDVGRGEPRDFAALVGPIAQDAAGLIEGAKARQMSTFEAYLLGRVEGTAKGHPWLDGLEYQAAAKFCEMIGAAAIHGSVARLIHLTDEDWRAAGAVGFDIASGGEDAIRAFLDGMIANYRSGQATAEGPNVFFGRLHQWLSKSDSSGLEPIRDLFRHHLLDVTAVAAGDVLYGATVEKRVKHSIRSASIEYKLHPKRLRKLIFGAGFVSEDQKDVPDTWVLFDADGAAELLQRAATGLSLKEAGEYLGSGRVQTKLLADNGVITPTIGSGAGKAQMAFACDDLNEFLARLLADAIPVATPEGAACDIPKAAKLANCSAIEIVRLIMDRKLAWVGRRAGASGYLSVLVDGDEIKRLVRGPAPDDMMTMLMVERGLNTTFAVVKALVTQGHLRPQHVISPLSRHALNLVSRADFESFRREFVSVHQLGIERGIHARALQAQLKAEGVKPALEKAVYGATFYRRKDC